MHLNLNGKLRADVLRDYKNVLLIIFFISCSISASGQSVRTPQSVYELPTIIPPSPTVSSFMKFEETQVDNYTGVPDISIPIFSTPSHSKDINIDISLKYHPSSIALEENAGYVGLGWNIFAGGTISRTVRGKPDENADGIYSYDNPYYSVVGIPGGPDLNNETTDVWQEYLWQNAFYGKYDSEHDLYQFNFMGHSGRFIMQNQCGLNQPCFVIKKIDSDNALKIEYSQLTNAAGIGTNQMFTIYDDRGYKYKFSIQEKTTSTSISENIPFQGVGSRYYTGGEQTPLKFISAFHLSKIYDKNNNIIVEFTYNAPETMMENTTDVSTTTNQMLVTIPTDAATSINYFCADADPAQLIEPNIINTRNNNVVDTRKIQEIDIKDIARISFESVGDRTDLNNPNAQRLKSVTVKNRLGDIVKKVELTPKYSSYKISANTIKKRMMLGEVSQTAGGKKLTYKMYYAESPDTLQVATKDYWGYRNAVPYYLSAGTLFRETDRDFCKTDVLQKMVLPTGGATLYQFESNTYSHIGSTPLTDFSSNPYNWILETDGPMTGFANTVTYDLRQFDNDQIVNFRFEGEAGKFVLERYSNGAFIDKDDKLHAGEYILLGGYQYKLKWTGFNGNIPGNPFPGGGDGPIIDPGNGNQTFGTVYATYFFRRNPEYKFLYGGGVRIAKIGYFENGNVPQNYYEKPEEQYVVYPVAKETLFNYEFFTDSFRSSGSLAFAKPVFEGGQSRSFNVRCMVGGETGVNPIDHIFGYSYKTTYDRNNLSPLRTKGSDVGYQNVEVKESGNGYSRFIYSSPIDHPEETYMISFPFISTSNKDYARGYLLNQKLYAQNGDILSETINNYNFITTASELKTGIRVFSDTSNGNTFCPFTKYYTTFEAYKTKLVDVCPQENPPSSTCLYCNNLYLTGYGDIRESFGWVKLQSSSSINYFYDVNHVQKAVQTNETFVYNSLNKKIATYTKDGSSTDDGTEIKYTYTNLPNNQISDITSVKHSNKNLNGTTQTGYQTVSWGTNGNAKGLPLQFAKSKSSTAPSDQQIVQEVYSYDEFGNITSMASGPGIGGYKTIIWGYSKTLPIAIIEGGLSSEAIFNNEPVKSYIIAAQAASGKTNTSSTDLYNENDVRTQLNAIRTALPQSKVTTFTYKPLVGVTSETSPQEYLQVYEYDEFNRLKSVKDAGGNLRSQNTYNYKTAN